MLRQMDGSHAVAEAVALCRPQVVACYPITPQTHIVEHLGELVKSEKLQGCEYLNVESEFAAMSACIGASAAGTRTYTATASQGLLFMMEAVYNASGLGLPIVMTLGNRAIGAPINIWNDHTDAMAARDSGWIQLFVETNQQAVDVHIQAFKLAEALSLPVMVNMDGFILTHAYERIDMPDSEQVDRFLPPFEPQQMLDPEHPVSIGAMVGPEAFTEVLYLAHHKQTDALELIPQQAAEFEAIFGRDSGGLLKTYDTEDADTIIVTLGSVVGTIKEVLAEMRAEGEKIGVVAIRSLRPFPKDLMHQVLEKARRVIVFEKGLAVGIGGVLALHVRYALGSYSRPMYSIIGGLGGRAITRPSLRKILARGVRDELAETEVLDLDMDAVERELERERAGKLSGPAAENILRDIGAVRAAKTG
ncbi:MAG: transketolase C-terminal domain-containing protein [Myxococcota bacterium]|nr:transketolase C-terminal domain-containing protein [Myxococcota bacterium]